MIVLVIRTRKPFFASRPGRGLLVSTALVVALAPPYTPLAGLPGFDVLPASLGFALAAIVVVYLFVAEAVKRWYFRTRPL